MGDCLPPLGLDEEGEGFLSCQNNLAWFFPDQR